MHSLNNILLAFAGGSHKATEKTFDEAAKALNEKLRSVENVPPEEFKNREGYAIEVAEQYLHTALPCCRLQHSARLRPPSTG